MKLAREHGVLVLRPRTYLDLVARR